MGKYRITRDVHEIPNQRNEQEMTETREEAKGNDDQHTSQENFEPLATMKNYSTKKTYDDLYAEDVKSLRRVRKSKAQRS